LDSYNWTSRLDGQIRTGRTGQAEKGRKNKIARIALSAHD
jgi:hypothetical protein